MPTLFDLPREIRDVVWGLVLQHDSAQLPFGLRHCVKIKQKGKALPVFKSSYHVLRTSKQFYREASPYLYETTAVHLLRPSQALRWIYGIGCRNSFCIRHLVLKFTSLESKPGSESESKLFLETWHLCLQLLPNLLSITFDYEPDRSNDYTTMPGLDNYQKLHESDMGLCEVLEKLTASSKPETLHLLRDQNRSDEMRQFRPELQYRPMINYASIAIDESMPSVLVLSFMKLPKRDTHISHEETITSLPPAFLADHGFRLSRTYTFIEDPEKPSIAMAYRKSDMLLYKPSVASLQANLVLSQLPNLLYLRLGCCHIDSSFLSTLPPGIQTLDVAFTDPDPVRVAANLRSMRMRCKQLFTLAIVVSPLHDGVTLNDEAELHNTKPLNYQGSTLVDTAKWEPFWQALSHVQSTGVRVWEGEGPGFRRVTKKNHTAS